MPKQLSLFQKGLLIGMHDRGMNAAEISKKFNIHRSTAYRIFSKYKKYGNVDHLKGNGRKCKLTPRNLRFISNLIKSKSCFTKKQILNELKNKNINVSLSTVKNAVHKLGYIGTR